MRDTCYLSVPVLSRRSVSATRTGSTWATVWQICLAVAQYAYMACSCQVWAQGRERSSPFGEEGSSAESKAAEGPELLGPRKGLAVLNSMKVAARSMVKGLEMGRLMGGGPSGPIYQAWYNDMRCVIKVLGGLIRSCLPRLLSSLLRHLFNQGSWREVVGCIRCVNLGRCVSVWRRQKQPGRL